MKNRWRFHVNTIEARIKNEASRKSIMKIIFFIKTLEKYFLWCIMKA